MAPNGPGNGHKWPRAGVVKGHKGGIVIRLNLQGLGKTPAPSRGIKSESNWLKG